MNSDDPIEDSSKSEMATSFQVMLSKYCCWKYLYLLKNVELEGS